MTEMPFIPEFKEAKERNKWIVDHAEYFTVIRRKNRRNIRDECATLVKAIERAQELILEDNSIRCLIYAVAGIHDTLAATISAEGVKYHD